MVASSMNASALLIDNSFVGYLYIIAIILPEIELSQGREYFEAFRKKMAIYDFSIDDKTLKITTSIGLADFHNTSLTDAMRTADKALYKAKSQGRNRIV